MHVGFFSRCGTPHICDEFHVTGALWLATDIEGLDGDNAIIQSTILVHAMLLEFRYWLA